MRPVIKKKRIDPRYFLNETVDRDEDDEGEGGEDEDGEDDKDDEDNEKESDGCAPVNIVKKSKSSKKDKKSKKDKTVLFGEEDLRAMVKEVIESFEEGAKEEGLEEDWARRWIPDFLQPSGKSMPKRTTIDTSKETNTKRAQSSLGGSNVDRKIDKAMSDPK